MLSYMVSENTYVIVDKKKISKFYNNNKYLNL